MKVANENGYSLFPINLGKQLSNKEAYAYLSLLFKSDYKIQVSDLGFMQSERSVAWP